MTNEARSRQERIAALARDPAVKAAFQRLEATGLVVDESDGWCAGYYDAAKPDPEGEQPRKWPPTVGDDLARLHVDFDRLLKRHMELEAQVHKEILNRDAPPAEETLAAKLVSLRAEYARLIDAIPWHALQTLSRPQDESATEFDLNLAADIVQAFLRRWKK